MWGQWFVNGMLVTLKRFFKPKITERYPEVYPNLPPRTRGSFVFDSAKCTSCNLCALACPNQVIHVATTKNAEQKRVLQSYTMSLSYCLYCGLCTEACPTSAIQMQAKFEHSTYDKTVSVKKWEAPC